MTSRTVHPQGLNNTDDTGYEYCYFLFKCNQNSEMTTDQTKLVDVYTMTSSVAFFILVAWIFYRNIWSWVQSFFIGYVSGVEADETEIKFADVEGIEAFVPHVKYSTMTDPMLCVDVREIPEEYLPIPKGFFDIRDDPQIFSVVKHEEFPNIDLDDELSLKVSERCLCEGGVGAAYLCRCV